MVTMPAPNAQQQLITASGKPVELFYYDLIDYRQSLSAMQSYTSSRDESSQDQVWLLQHPPVYTQGTACEQVPHLPTTVPLEPSDRGGQITYHGPGQLIMYPLINLKRFNIGIKALVASLEQAVIDLLDQHSVYGERRSDAPGVYVDGDKIAALGLRIRHGCSYHGLSLNVDMNLAPFAKIDPCGYVGLGATQLKDHCQRANFDLGQIGQDLVERFCAQF